MEFLTATYIADLRDLMSDGAGTRQRLADAERVAEAFATGQSIGTWVAVPGITPEMRERHGARVVEIRPLADNDPVGGEAALERRTAASTDERDRWLLRVEFPVDNFGPQFPMLFTTLLGNDPSTSLPVRLVDLDVPATFLASFGGPRFGIRGWRNLTGVERRPILLNMIKPCTGYGPRVGADFVEEVARGGCDLIKDDELLADPDFNRVAERSRVYAERLDRVAEETGHRSRYVANVTTRVAVQLDTARAAVDAGADAVMINGLAVGLDVVQLLADAGLGVPILVHTAGLETFSGAPNAGLGRAVLLGRLLRLAGADAVLLENPYGRRPPPHQVIRATVAQMRHDWGDISPTTPVIGGGLTAEMVEPLVAEFGVDFIVAAGGAIQGHPHGATEGVRVMLASIEAAARAHTAGTAGLVGRPR